MHNPTPTPEDDFEAYRPIWAHFNAMIRVAARDPQALAHYDAGQRAAAASKRASKRRQQRVITSHQRLNAAGIFVEDIYATSDGLIQIEVIGSEVEVYRDLTTASFTVHGTQQDSLRINDTEYPCVLARIAPLGESR